MERRTVLNNIQSRLAREGSGRVAEDGGESLNNNNGVGNSSRVNNAPHNQDLDSSNVLYDDDFEIEEEKHNY